MAETNIKKYKTISGVTIFGWYILLCIPLYISLCFIPYFDLYYLLPSFGGNFGLMPKLNKFLGAYSADELNVYNIIVWQTIIVWACLLVLNTIVVRILVFLTATNSLAKSFNLKSYFKKFTILFIFPGGLALIFYFYDIQIMYSGLNNFDYVENKMLEQYVYRQCQLFFTHQAMFSMFLILMTAVDSW